MTVTANGASATTYYVYDGTMLIREMQSVNGTLTPTATYFQGPSGPAYRRDDTTGQVRWYVYDGLGSVVGEVDPLGNLTSSGQYDVYGSPRSNTITGTKSSPQGFVGALGHQTDPETGGLIYMQARYYDPGTGRFVSEDPGRNGENWYGYAGNDPTNGVDSDGRATSAVSLELSRVTSWECYFIGTAQAAVSLFACYLLSLIPVATATSRLLFATAVLNGCGAVYSFALAFGCDQQGVFEAISNNMVGPAVVGICIGVTAADKMNGVADGICAAAVTAYGTYSLELLGAMISDG